MVVRPLKTRWFFLIKDSLRKINDSFIYYLYRVDMRGHRKTILYWSEILNEYTFLCDQCLILLIDRVFELWLIAFGVLDAAIFTLTTTFWELPKRSRRFFIVSFNSLINSQAFWRLQNLFGGPGGKPFF